MSINNIYTIDASNVEYMAEVEGPRKYLVRNTPENIRFVRDIYNEKVKPYLVDFDTIEVIGFKVLSHEDIYQRVNVRIKYKDPLGKEHFQNVGMKRYDLYQVLLTKLELDDKHLLLECDTRTDLGIMIAIKERTGFSLNLAEVRVIDTEKPNIKILEARHNCYGWFGEVYLRLL